MKTLHPDKCGIYAIFGPGGKAYVGQSVNFDVRETCHRGRLRLGTHHSRKLSNAWAKYGADAFTFVFIERCGLAELDATEEKWINFYKAGAGVYNVAPVRCSCFGTKWSPESRERNRTTRVHRRGHKLSPEHRAKISAGLEGRIVSEKTKLATHTPEANAKRSLKMRGRKMPEGFGERQSERQRGNPMEAAHKALKTPEVRAKISAIAKLRGFPEETRIKAYTAEAIAKNVAKRIGAKRTPEQIERMKAGRKLNPPKMTDELRAKFSARAKAHWEKVRSGQAKSPRQKRKADSGMDDLFKASKK